MCCALGESGRALLGERKLPPSVDAPDADRPNAAALAAMRTRVHLLGWLLALEARLGTALLAVRGPRRLAIAPPNRAGRPIGPGDLNLPGSRTPRDFLRRQPNAAPIAPEAFGAVTPLAGAEISLDGARRAELLVDVVTNGAEQALADALERYDHMLAGWWSQAHRGEPPRVVLVCADAVSAASAARLADATLTASHAYPGEEPRDWPRPGRERIFFVAEQDLHAGQLHALRVPARPPGLRANGDDGEPRPGDFLDAPASRPAAGDAAGAAWS
jgi:hypothetical protein